jgi:hypothetical protein
MHPPPPAAARRGADRPRPAAGATRFFTETSGAIHDFSALDPYIECAGRDVACGAGSPATWEVLVRLQGTAPVLAALIALVAPASAAAQDSVKSFDQLNTRLKPGDRVWVTGAQGREVEGRIERLSADGLTPNADGATPGKGLVAYRAPGPAGASGHAGLSIAPVITPRTRGLAVSFAF